MKLTIFYVTSSSTRKYFSNLTEARSFLKYDKTENWTTRFETHPDEMVFTNKHEIVQYLNQYKEKVK